MKNLKVGTRLILGFGMIMVLMLIIGGYAISEIKSLESDLNLLVKDRMVKVEQTNQILANVNIIARGLRNILIDDNHDHQTTEIQRIGESRKKISEIFDDLSKTITSEKGIVLVKKAAEGRSAYIGQYEKYMDLIRADQIEPAKKLLINEMRDAQRDYMSSIGTLSAYQTSLADETGKTAEKEAARSTIIIAVLIGVATVTSGLMSFLIIRSITGPVGKAATLAESMAKGDFTGTIEVDQHDEIGLMAKSLNTMVGQLGGMIREIITGVNRLTSQSNDMAIVSKQLSSAAKDTSDRADTVAAAAEEMSANIQSVSAAMEQSSGNVNMVASSTEEMTATVNEIAQSAEKARSISESAVQQSRQTSEKMAELGSSARKIGRVTETITEISEQTNLLALNATIEAARAGDAGKGFAVVANEIKELARQTAAATVDIKNQIDEMQNTTASTVGDIEKISGIILEINNVINGIATAVEEQSAASGEISNNIAQASQGIAEVNENVAQSTVVIGDITRDIASINQQSTQVGDGSNQVQESAQGLASLAAQLEKLVKQFKV